MTAKGKTVLITGGNTGLGLEIAKRFAQTGDWFVVIASRSVEKSEEAVLSIKEDAKTEDVACLALDLSSTDSVRKFAAEYVAGKFPPLQSVVCNAGMTSLKMQKSGEGMNLIFAVNHLGHYLLLHLLSSQLVAPARVVILSSGVHIPSHRLARACGVPVPLYTTAQNVAFPDKAPDGQRIERGTQAYSTSKLCNVLNCYELARQFEKAGVDASVFAVDPGLMPDTDLAREAPAALRAIFKGLFTGLEPLMSGVRKSPISAGHILWMVTEPKLEGRTALYFDGDVETKSSPDSYDRSKAADLWNTSSDLCALKPTETMLPLNVTATA